MVMRPCLTSCCIVAVLFASSCSDPGCSQDNLKKVATQCLLSPIGPDIAACDRAWGFASTPPVADADPYLSADCNARGQGPLFQCLGDKAAMCNHTTFNSDVLDACTANEPAVSLPNATCAGQCETARADCVTACTKLLKQPLTKADYDSCLSCTDLCGRNELSCENNCPRQ